MTKKISVSVDYDQDPINPREANDNLGTMVCFHKRYVLGDKHNYSSPGEFIFDRLENYIGDEDKAEEKYNEIAESIDKKQYQSHGDYRRAVDKAVIDFIKTDLIKPLFLYDHSMQSISTGSFDGRAPHARFDSGQVGWIYATEEDVAKTFGDSSDESWQKAEEILESEVNEYDFYIQGLGYEFTIKENDNIIDSCSGFMGDFKDVIEQMKECVPDEFKHLFDIVEDCGIEYEETIIDPIAPAQHINSNAPEIGD